MCHHTLFQNLFMKLLLLLFELWALFCLNNTLDIEENDKQCLECLTSHDFGGRCLTIRILLYSLYINIQFSTAGVALKEIWALYNKLDVNSPDHFPYLTLYTCIHSIAQVLNRVVTCHHISVHGRKQ